MNIHSANIFSEGDFIMQKKNIMYTITILLMVLLSCSIFFLRNNSYAASNTTDKTLCYKPVMVEQGDSLWSIANENLSPEWDSTEEYVAAIRKLNSLHDSKIKAGTYISIPYYADLGNK